MIDQEQEPDAPAVFVSHGSEDKDRFVLEFARRLYAAGIRAWVDKWEMLPGDSLVEKLFEDGMRSAEAVVIVLSQNSVVKPWVREELNYAIVSRIERKVRIIPVLIDDCAVPEALKSTLWVKIGDINNYDDEFAQIVDAIHHHYDRPALGRPPAYISQQIAELSGLTKIDTLVFKSVYDDAMKFPNLGVIVKPDSTAMTQAGVSGQAVHESLTILNRLGLVNGTRTLGGGYATVMPTIYGFEVYGQAFIEGFDTTVNKIMVYVVNHVPCAANDIAVGVGCAEIVVNYVLRLLDQQRLARVSFSFGGDRVVTVDVALTRKLRDAG